VRAGRSAGGVLVLELTKARPSLEIGRALVSVLIPAFKPRFFAEAMESVLAQTYSNLEIVICDDCPTDEIKEPAVRYAARDPRIRYFRNGSTLGSRENHIRCLSLASGDLIKFLSDDDRLHPRCLERLVACLAAYPDVTLVTSHRQCIDEAGNRLPDMDATSRPVGGDSRVDGAALARAVLLHGGFNLIGGPSTTMFRRADLADIRPDIFSLGGRRYETMGDLVMWLNLLSKGDAIYMVETLSDFRLHADQEMRTERVRATSGWNLARMQADAARMGLVPEDAPPGIAWTPLTTSNAAARAATAGPAAPERRQAAGEATEPPLLIDGDIYHWPAANQLVGGLVAVEGWVCSLPATNEVALLVDGCTWPAWIRRMSGSGGEPPSAWPAGANARPFRLMFDTRMLADGRHVLTFEARCQERTLILGRRPVVVRNQDLLGAADGPASEVVDHLVREQRALQERLEVVARERDEAEERLQRVLDTWPVRLYGLAVRLRGAGGFLRRLFGFGR
jgi:hypothetical protein